MRTKFKKHNKYKEYIVTHYIMSKYIDKIFYINLDKREDRRQEIEEELKKYGLEAERYAAIPTPHSGIIGCGYSHLNVLKLAKERGYRNVLIFEDDYEFIVSKEEMEESLTTFFETSPNYDVCMISYIVQRSEEVQNNPHIRKIIDGQTASGYIVNGHYLDTLIELYSWAIPALERTNEHWNYANDLVWKRLQPGGNWFYLTKRLGRQRASYSDNKMCFVPNNDGV
jgi:GR25 family glycosyltransferase involved in LPS biosynthesis